MKQKRILMIAMGLIALLVALVAGVSAQETTPEPTTPAEETPFLGVFYDAGAETLEIEVMRRSPAYDAGLRDGDVITAVNGETVTPADFADTITAFAPEDVIIITVDRDSESLDFEVTLGARTMIEIRGRGQGNMPPMWEGQMPPMMEVIPMPFDFEMGGMGMGMMFGANQGRLGVSFFNIDATLAEENGLSVTEGALITAVDPESPAEAAGFLADDIVIAVNGEPVDEERTLADRMVAYEAGDEVTFTVLRGEETLELVATLAQHQQRLFGEMRMMPGMRGMMPPHGNMMPSVPPVQVPEEVPPVEVTPNA